MCTESFSKGKSLEKSQAKQVHKGLLGDTDGVNPLHWSKFVFLVQKCACQLKWQYQTDASMGRSKLRNNGCFDFILNLHIECGRKMVHTGVHKR